MFRAAMTGLLLCSMPVLAEEPLKIIDYPVEKVALYDEQGEFQGDIRREELPRPVVPVLSYDQDKDLILIALPDRQVWLDPLDVKLNRGKTVAFDCRKVAETSLATDSKINAVMGYSQACGK
ncbi:hypothetical protein ACFPU0_10855 [Pseudomonas sp. GCM10022186]|uniref:hypothetical protein n=1 Tax=Pseudomonas sp. GCM10022186 TaxID=3252650 RepID=UPI0036128DAE